MDSGLEFIDWFCCFYRMMGVFILRCVPTFFATLLFQLLIFRFALVLHRTYGSSFRSMDWGPLFPREHESWRRLLALHFLASLLETLT